MQREDQFQLFEMFIFYLFLIRQSTQLTPRVKKFRSPTQPTSSLGISTAVGAFVFGSRGIFLHLLHFLIVLNLPGILDDVLGLISRHVSFLHKKYCFLPYASSNKVNMNKKKINAERLFWKSFIKSRDCVVFLFSSFNRINKMDVFS